MIKNNNSWPTLIEDIFKDRWESLPLLASYAGVSGFDHTLGDFSPQSLSKRLEVKKELLKRLKAHRPPDAEGRLDHRVLLGQLTVQITEIEVFQRARLDPALYPLNIIRSLNVLLIRDYSAPYRREMMKSRLSEVPAALRAGLSNLKDVDDGMAQLALAACRSGEVFLREALAGRGFAVDAANAALESYAREVRARLLPKAKRRFPIGPALFNLKLRLEHGLPYDAKSLREAGLEAVAHTRGLLEAASRRIDPNSNWRHTVAKLKKDHPGSDDLLASYRRESLRAKRFCRDLDLVTFPKGEQLSIIPTPRFEWDTTPYAAMLPPGPFEKSLRSTFWVTPVDPAWPRGKKLERLMGHCRHGLPSVCPHEGYPGHHIQLARAATLPGKVRAVFSTPVMVEGWAFYCEQMMEETGFIADPKAKLYRLVDQLWRACRVVIDAGLHVDGWSRRRAVDFLVREARLEETNAVAEVDRYCTTPTQPMSYYMGKSEILKLRARCRKEWGVRYSLKSFHDWLLDFGSMPPSWISPKD